MANAMHLRRNLTLVGLAVSVMILVLAASASVARAHEGPALTPGTVNAVIFPGASMKIAKTVHLPAIPPRFDLCLVQDETGSFFDDLPNMQTQIPLVVAALNASGSDYASCVSGFRDFAQDGWGNPGDWVYRLVAPVGAGGGPLIAGVAALTAGGGNDTPEAQLEALHYLATPAHPAIDSNGAAGGSDTPIGQQPAWRSGSQRIVLIATDAVCHVTGDSGGWPGDAGTANVAATVAALNAAHITVIGLTPGGAGTIPCIDALAAGTGGSVQAIGADSSQIAAAILNALRAVQVTVSMTSDCSTATGGVVTTSFTPASLTGTGGTDLEFAETIGVSASAPGGTYACKDWALVVNADGSVSKFGDDPATPADETIYELKTIRVPEGFLTGGGQLKNGNGNTAAFLSWGGNVGYLADFTIVGEWETNFHNVAGTALDGAKFHAHDFVTLQFTNDAGSGPNPPPANANIAWFRADGMLDKAEGYTLIVCVADRGEPGRGHDTMRMWLYNPGGLVYDSASDFTSQAPQSACMGHLFDAGNIQIHSGVK